MKALTPDTLTPAQAQIVAALAQGATTTEAARSAGVHRSTVYHWLKTEASFHDAVEQARAGYAATLRDELQVLSRDALATLRSLLDDPGTPRTLRFRVAMAILQRAPNDWNLPEAVSSGELEELTEVSNLSNASNLSELPEESNVLQVSKVSKVSNLSNGVEPASRNIPRNQPCPCGSGRKYKKCCYLQEHPSLPVMAA
ncbi:MAG: SEC-C metal-binding domain-containing protein [Bryobacteraceae bacterium]